MQSSEQKTNPKTSKTVAAIDVGANSLRMVIAEVADDGRIEVLERLQRAVRLGQDTFRRGRLGGESMRSALYGFARLSEAARSLQGRKNSRRGHQRSARGKQQRHVPRPRFHGHAVAGRRDRHLRGEPAHGLRRAQGRGTRAGSGSGPVLDRRRGRGQHALVDTPGRGDCHIAKPALGSIRLQEMLSTSEESPHRSADLLRQHIANALTTLESSLPLGEIKSYVAVGGDVRFAAREIGKPTESADLVIVDRADFDRFVERCERYAPDELSKRHGIPFAEAETLNPALLVYQTLLHKTGAGRMIVSHVSMRDGLLLELAREVTGQEDEALLAGVIHSATAIAEKYRVDLNHARSVAETAVRLFDFLQADHGLGARYRLLVRVAGLLHEVGQFVSNRAHHKHSEYLISNSEIFGLNRGEIALVAQIARYHRAGCRRRATPCTCRSRGKTG